jgi:hypothetical protein
LKFRLKAFGYHVLGSACVLAVALGVLYFGWYQWPGWYLTGVFRIAAILAGVDVTLGPLFTLLVANPAKPRRELARDISIIVAVQLVALGYGLVTLWQGRPLYYTFSVDRLETVQASSVPPTEVSLARSSNPELAPYWYSRPRWVWAPLPENQQERDQIVGGVVSGEGVDVISMPRYFNPWSAGLGELRKRLKAVDSFFMFTKDQKQLLKQRMIELGYPPDAANTLFLTGQGTPLLAVFDPKTLKLQTLIRAD